MQKIKISSIERNILNPRKNFDEAKLQELADSIREVGIIEPLVVSAFNPEHGDGELRFRIIAGERRWKAATLASLDKVPCIVKFDLTPDQEIRLALTENLQRQDLDPIEEARAYRLLLDMSKEGRTQERLAAELGVSQAHIANRIRLLELPEEIQENISRGIISPSVAKELLAGKKVSPQVVEKVAKKAADEGLTVKQTADALARETYSSSRPLTGGQYNSPKFDTNDCDGCKKKTMLKCPWADREELRCLDADCWDDKQGEFEKAKAEEQEKEYLAKYPDAVIIDDLKQKMRNLYSLAEYCKAKGCPSFKVGRWRGRSCTENICLNPESFEACYENQNASQKQEEAEEKDSAAKEIEQLVSAKLASFGWHKDALIYIAGAMLSGFDEFPAHCDVYEYIESVAGPLPDGWEDGLAHDAEGWPHLLPILEGFDESQLIRIIFEWPALALGMEPAGMVEWFLKGVPGEETPCDPDPDGHGVCRVCGCTDDMACPGGCYWVEPDLCSRCAGVDKEEPGEVDPDICSRYVTFSCARPDDACPHCKVMGKPAPREPHYPSCMGCEHLRWAEKRKEETEGAEEMPLEEFLALVDEDDLPPISVKTQADIDELLGDDETAAPEKDPQERVLLEPSGDANCANCGVDKETCQQYQTVVSDPEDCVCDEWIEKPDAVESDLKDREAVKWILNNSCGDNNYDPSRLTDEELMFCLEHEERKSGMKKLVAESMKRGFHKKPEPEPRIEHDLDRFLADQDAATDNAAHEPEPKTYLDQNQGRELFVSEGLWMDGQALQYGTFWKSPSGGLHRVKSPAMPMVATREEAQANLDAWAEKKGLKPVTEEPSDNVKAILEADDVSPRWKELLDELTDVELLQAISRECRPRPRAALRKEARRRKLNVKAEAS